MLPDTQSLLSRSGAAAPLLNAVRGKAGAEAVRGALERLTGSQRAPAVTGGPSQ